MDKKQLQLEYEVLGRSVQEIANAHNISVKVLEYTIQEQAWKRLPIADTFTSWKHGENPSEDLLSQVDEASRLVRTLQDSEITPQIMVAKQALLSKTRQMIQEIEDPGELKVIAEVLQLLTPQSALPDAQSEGLKVMIVNQFNEPNTNSALSGSPSNGSTPKMVAELEPVTVDITNNYKET